MARSRTSRRRGPSPAARMPRQAPPVARHPSPHRLASRVVGAALPCEEICSGLNGVAYQICLSECRRLADRLA